MTPAHTPTNFNAPALDSRDLISRMEHLTYLEESGPLSADESTELSHLQEVNGAGSEFTEWPWGVTLNNHENRGDWAYEFVSELCGPSELLPYVIDNVNWSGVADDMIRYDYNEIEVAGSTFFFEA